MGLNAEILIKALSKLIDKLGGRGAKAEIGRRTGLSPFTITKIMEGQSQPQLETWEKLHIAFPEDIPKPQGSVLDVKIWDHQTFPTGAVPWEHGEIVNDDKLTDAHGDKDGFEKITDPKHREGNLELKVDFRHSLIESTIEDFKRWCLHNLVDDMTTAGYLGYKFRQIKADAINDPSILKEENNKVSEITTFYQERLKAAESDVPYGIDDNDKDEE